MLLPCCEIIQLFVAPLPARLRNVCSESESGFAQNSILHAAWSAKTRLSAIAILFSKLEGSAESPSLLRYVTPVLIALAVPVSVGNEIFAVIPPLLMLLSVLEECATGAMSLIVSTSSSASVHLSLPASKQNTRLSTTKPFAKACRR